MNRSPAEPITGSKVHLYLPTALHAALRDIARERDQPVSRTCRAALREFVERHRYEAASD